MAIQPCKLSRGGNGWKFGPRGHCYSTKERAQRERGQHDGPLASKSDGLVMLEVMLLAEDIIRIIKGR